MVNTHRKLVPVDGDAVGSLEGARAESAIGLIRHRIFIENGGYL